ncbi:MAG TPA: T9SS type A sorting domain-containing protein, partial [Bacteroidia bacterium]|nr:T9SS type A sorting domain-containing protein [Bacteroidia bacterium]
IAVTFDICNGVSAPGQLDALQVYPNPAQQELRINSAERIDVRWFDETGMLVRTDRLFAGTNRIAPGLPAGIYFLRFERDGLMQTIRVILLP